MRSLVRYNGTVEFADFLILSGNFGKVVDVASVPEPTSQLIAMLACLALLGLRRRIQT